MKKKVLCITLTLLLLLPLLAACAPSNEGTTDPPTTPTTGTPGTEAPGSNELDPVTLVWHIGGRAQRDQEMVMTELNAYLKEKINTEIDMRFTTHADYQQKMSTIVGAGEEYDLAYVSTTFFNPVVNAQNGAFVEIDELLPEYAPNLLNEVPGWVIEGAKIAGKTYIIPSYKDVADVFSFVYNKSLSDDLGLDMTGSWKTIFDLEERFYEFKEARDAKYPDKADIPMMTAYRTMGAWLPSDILMGSAVANIEGIETFEGKGKGEIVFNQYDTEEYREMMRLQRQLVDDGIVAYDTKNYDPDKVREKSGDTAFRLGQGLVAVDDHYYSDDWVVSLVVSDYSIPSTAYLHAAGTAVSVTSKNPERAVMLQDLVYADQYVATTMRFGLKGEDKHYVIDDNGRLDVSKGLNADPSDRGFYRWYGAESGNLFKAILPASQPDNLFDAIQASNDNAANFTSNLGFVMVQEDVANEREK
ncbi:MAG: extracellular solute-binding protein [Clostridiales bacterium]|nr:extracellular solute-binding protein [Clostridiales bacterium]